MQDSFDQRKRNVLSSLESPCELLKINQGDKSRKGSVDAPIAGLCSKINAQKDIYTTSSCSGRISVFAEPDLLSRSQGKKGGEWVYASHEIADEEQVLARIIDRKAAGSLVLRFEPFILHAECRTLQEASRVLLAARNAGYRESGATLGARVMIAIRCSLRLEVPVADDGDLLVTETYLRYLIRLANGKFRENEERVGKLESQLDLIWDQRPSRGLAAFNHAPSVIKGGGSAEGLTSVPMRPRALIPPQAQEGSVDPRRLLLGRQLSLLKRIKALERSSQVASEPSDEQRSPLPCLPQPRPQPAAGPSQLPTLPQDSNSSPELVGQWRKVPLDQNGSSLTVSRWGHASVLLPNGTICIIGGYGGHQGVSHTRMADILLISTTATGNTAGSSDDACIEGRLSAVEAVALDAKDGVMAARQGHSATLVDGSRILVVGGRSSPAEAFDDVWMLDVTKWTWLKMKLIIRKGQSSLNVPSGRYPSGRYRHSAVKVTMRGGQSGVLIFGGRDGGGSLLGDLWLIQSDWDDSQTLICTHLPPLSHLSTIWPSPRKSHAMVATGHPPLEGGGGGHVYLHGGAGAYGEHYDVMYCLDVDQISSFISGAASGVEWRKIKYGGEGDEMVIHPPGCFSHTLTFSPHQHRLHLIGGHPGTHHSSLYSFDLRTERWERKDLRMPSVSEFVPVRHTSHCMGSRLIIVGGGAFCFSFGTIFSAVWTINPMAINADSSSLPAPINPQEPSGLSMSPTADFSKGSWALEVPVTHAKAVKDALKASSWLDKLLKVKVADGRVTIPLNGPKAPASIASRDSSRVPPAVLTALDGGARLVKSLGMKANNKADHQDPKSSMRAAVTFALKDRNVSANLLLELLNDLPHKWEKLGDLALIPALSVSHPAWRDLFDDMASIWVVIAKAIGVQRLARQQPIANNGTRDSAAVMLLGSDGWTSHKEGKVTYCLDVTKCMFSSGNCSERIRMGRLNSAGKVVVDLFCGIGYFSLSFIVNGGAAKVYAIDWNPHAIDALNKNLTANHISSQQCQVIQGDCRIVSPKGVADRVSLGLIPSSRVGWEAGVAALRPAGGWLHVHFNVKDSEVGQWARDAALEIEAIAADQGREGWRARVDHVERVKSYAPHVIHIVVDIYLGPSTPLNPPPVLQSSSHPISSQDSPLLTFSRLFSFEALPSVEIIDAKGKDRDWFHDTISSRRKPVVLSGLNLGPCVQKWSIQHLLSLPSSQSTMVSVHVTDDEEGALDFVNKNFSFETMTLSDLLAKVSSPSSASQRRYYLRSIGVNPRKEPANLSESFPVLAADVTLPLHLLPHESAMFSTVLRISSPGIRLWTHYDVMDNFLLQVKGRKRILLWPPSDHDSLYIEGSSSPVIQIFDPSVLSSYPKLAAASTPTACILEPGQVLFIPSLWFHNVASELDGPTVSINSFFRHLPDDSYERKDLYGNRDLVEANVADAAIGKAIESLNTLPDHYKEFYKSRAISRMKRA